MNPFPAIVLAAGSSTRMGRDKAFLPWVGDQPLVAWTVAAMESAGWDPVVVAGPHNIEALAQLLGVKRAVLNPDPAGGKTGSIRTGIDNLRTTTGPLLLASIDQPRPSTIYRELRVVAETHPEGIHVPDSFGRRGHPVVFGAEAWGCLDTISDAEQGLRGVLDRHNDSLVRWPLPHTSWDFNEPEVYESALAEADHW